jgi:hypothetical protein
LENVGAYCSNANCYSLQGIIHFEGETDRFIPEYNHSFDQIDSEKTHGSKKVTVHMRCGHCNTVTQHSISG